MPHKLKHPCTWHGQPSSTEQLGIFPPSMDASPLQYYHWYVAIIKVSQSFDS